MDFSSSCVKDSLSYISSHRSFTNILFKRYSSFLLFDILVRQRVILFALKGVCLFVVPSKIFPKWESIDNIPCFKTLKNPSMIISEI